MNPGDFVRMLSRSIEYRRSWGGVELSNEEALDIDTMRADGETIEKLFQSILGRTIGDEAFKREHDGIESINYWVRRLVGSEEFRDKFIAKHGLVEPEVAE